MWRQGRQGAVTLSRQSCETLKVWEAAVAEKKAEWEAAAAARVEAAAEEAFRAAWYRALAAQRGRGNRRVTGVLAELEWQAEYEKFARGH